jgi:hypothetical protein
MRCTKLPTDGVPAGRIQDACVVDRVQGILHCNAVDGRLPIPLVSDAHSQLGLALGLLHDGLHLGRLHDVALELELSGHEELLGVGLAGDELGKVGVGEGEGD